MTSFREQSRRLSRLALQEAMAGRNEAAAKAREEARIRAATAQADVMDNVEAGTYSGEAVPQPTPGKGTLSS